MLFLAFPDLAESLRAYNPSCPARRELGRGATSSKELAGAKVAGAANIQGRSLGGC